MKTISRTVICNQCKQPLERDKAVRNLCGELVHRDCLGNDQDLADGTPDLTGPTKIAGLQSDNVVDLMEAR